MKSNLKFYVIISILFSFSSFAQRGQTGDKTFADRYPPDVNNQTTSTYLKVENTVDHDIIVCIRDQNKKVGISLKPKFHSPVSGIKCACRVGHCALVVSPPTRTIFRVASYRTSRVARRTRSCAGNALTVGMRNAVSVTVERY